MIYSSIRRKRGDGQPNSANLSDNLAPDPELIGAGVGGHPVQSRYVGADRDSLGCVGLAWPRHVFQ